MQVLWDEMADFDAASADEALEHLMRFLQKEFDAANVAWFTAIRLQEVEPDCATMGWRQRAYGYLFPQPELSDLVEEETERMESNVVDVTTVRNLALVGTWRANRLVDLAGPDWFESAFYRYHYVSHGHSDAIWAGCPVNADAEVYFGLYRSLDQPHFTPEERDQVGVVLRGLKWFYRQLFLSRGLGIADVPLTAMERIILRSLLSGQTEREIAEQQGQSPHTTHHHVKAIYRKFGITNRAALMAIWLGRDV